MIPMLDLSQCQWKPEDLLKAVALLGAAIAFGIGLFQYRRAQQWKRAEWVAQEMKLLFGNLRVQSALLMIDWGSRRIPLYPERENVTDRYVLLTNEMVARALMLHSERSEGFSDLEADIREAFDQLLDGFERFNAYVEAGLVKLSDLRPYLKYWATNILRAVSSSEHRLVRLRAYMKKYGFDGAYKLLERIVAEESRINLSDRRQSGFQAEGKNGQP
jgi:hypothetical protein